MSVSNADAIAQALAAPTPEWAQAPLCVGFSGGLDSSVLLHALAASPGVRERGLRACHVDHGLHPNAADWAAHCARFCAALGLELTVARVSVARDSGDGPEAAARRARHAAFAAELREGEILALAHHLDDQAETLLLRLLRGSGPDGLAAMRAWREYGRGRLWRPLLDLPREALRAYALQHRLRWIDDPSNQEDRFDRNFLRHRIMPLLRERWPGADRSFAQSARLSGEASRLLESEDAAALARTRGLDPQVLSRSALLALPPTRRARVLRRWIAALGLPPLPAQGVARIENELLRARPDAQAQFVWHGAIVRAWRDLLHAERWRPAWPEDWRRGWDGRAPLALPGGGEWRLERLEAADGFDWDCVAHARIGGERIVLPGRAHAHALKQVLQDFGIPPWERARLPLLSTGEGELLAVGDLVYSARMDAWLRERGARLLWVD